MDNCNLNKENFDCTQIVVEENISDQAKEMEICFLLPSLFLF